MASAARVWQLAKELRLADVSDMERGNRFVAGFIERCNAQFSVMPACPENLHRTLNVTPGRLRDILCHREQRYVNQQLTISYQRNRIMLERSGAADGAVGQHVGIYDFADAGMEVRWKGMSLPYVAFDKDQRVSHTAIVENKQLGGALAFIKAQRDLEAPEPRVKSNSEAGGYRRSGRKPGRPSGFPSVAVPKVSVSAERSMAGKG